MRVTRSVSAGTQVDSNEDAGTDGEHAIGVVCRTRDTALGPATLLFTTP
jgi:hypothetical protein